MLIFSPRLGNTWEKCHFWSQHVINLGPFSKSHGFIIFKRPQPRMLFKETFSFGAKSRRRFCEQPFFFQVLQNTLNCTFTDCLPVIPLRDNRDFVFAVRWVFSSNFKNKLFMGFFLLRFIDINGSFGGRRKTFFKIF